MPEFCVSPKGRYLGSPQSLLIGARKPSTALLMAIQETNLVALDLPARGLGYEILGEWPRREQIAPSALRQLLKNS